MRSKIVWSILRHMRKVWVRVVFFALLALLTAGAAPVLAPFIPSGWTVTIGADAVDQVLNILATSMLAVTTFSLGISTSAFAAAAQTATPRATALLQEDPTAQNVLATFLGAFLFSLVGIIALQAGYYSSNGRLVLFVMTALVVAAVVVALLRWISHLVSFGRMEDILDRVEARATVSLTERLEAPYLGGRPLFKDIPRSCIPLFPNEIGYVQHIDMGALQSSAETLEVECWVSALPGAFVHPARAILHIDAGVTDQDTLQRLRNAFSVGVARDFDQDPRFGLVVLSEIASRALSPAVNDPGTAIGVIGRLVRIMARWREGGDHPVDFPSVLVPPIWPEEMLEDAFHPIMRDGKATVEVQIRLHKALDALVRMAPLFAEAAGPLAAEGRARSRANFTEREMGRLERLAEECAV